MQSIMLSREHQQNLFVVKTDASAHICHLVFSLAPGGRHAVSAQASGPSDQQDLRREEVCGTGPQQSRAEGGWVRSRDH